MRINVKQLVILVSGVGLLLCLGLAALLYTSGPRVRLVSFEVDPETTSQHLGTTMTLSFDRAIEDRDYSSALSFEPQLSFDTQTSRQAITIRFDQNLQHNTNYTLTLKDEVVDSTGRKMDTQYQYEFMTGQPSYIYLERNYSNENFSAQTQYVDTADDRIILESLSGREETLFTHPQISMFAVSKDYLVVATKNTSQDDLHIINRATGESRKHVFFNGGRLRDLQLSPNGKVAVYRVVPDVEVVSTEYFNTYANRIDSLDLETEDTRTLTDANGDFIRALSIELDDSGLVVLVQDVSQTFYAASPFNDYEPVRIGARAASYGFSEDSSEIVFRDSEALSLYDVLDTESRPLDLDFSRFIDSITSQSSGIYLSSTSYSGRSPVSFLERIESWDDESIELLWTNDNFTNEALINSRISYDGQLAALQLNPDGCVYDRVGGNNQCSTTHTVLFDVSTGKEIRDVRGFDLIWLP